MQPQEKTFRNVIESSVRREVIDAARAVSAHLTASGVRHALVGALAIGVYGWPRATKDVDVLLGDEVWIRDTGGGLTPRIELPPVLCGVGIDYLPIDVGGPFLEIAVSAPYWTEGLPIAPPEVVVCTKLFRHASRDRTDIIEMLKAGLVAREPIREYLAEHTPVFLRRWAELVADAEEELAKGV